VRDLRRIGSLLALAVSLLACHRADDCTGDCAPDLGSTALAPSEDLAAVASDLSTVRDLAPESPPDLAAPVDSSPPSDGSTSACSATTCGAGAQCGPDGLCVCAEGFYSCGDACCAYTKQSLSSSTGSCTYDLDIAARAPNQWSLVTFAETQVAPDPSAQFEVRLYVRQQDTSDVVSTILVADDTYAAHQPTPYHAAVDLDANGVAHIAHHSFNAGQIRYVPVVAGTVGVAETVQFSSLVEPDGGTLDLLVDPVGTVHVVFPVTAIGGSGSSLVHAQRATAGWSFETIADSTTQSFAGPVAIARADNGDLVVGYVASGAAFSIHLARHGAAGWTDQAAGTQTLRPRSLRVDGGGGEPTVTWDDPGIANADPGRVMMYDAASGVTTPIYSVTSSAFGPMLAVGADLLDVVGRQHVFASAWFSSPAGLYDLSQWMGHTHADLIDSGTVTLLAGARDPGGDMHLAYCTQSTMTHLIR
jgi:hypothetical protein